MNSPLLSEERLLTLPSDQVASGRTLGQEEISLLTDVINSGTLTSTKGTFVATLEARFGDLLGVRHVCACSSGTAAVHAAIAAINPNPGDEVITSAVTDMGALTPILYQGAVPVFADVDSRTCNLTARTIEDRLSDRTRAIIVTHLFGNPCNMQEIMELAGARNIPVIEDCAQAYLARHDSQLVGTIGTIGCFSLQQGKHITTGEGGIITTNDDALGRRIFLFVNKAWGYGDEHPDHYFLALNYRMSELQGAVAVAQLPKLGPAVKSRVSAAEKLTARLHRLPGIETPWVEPGNTATYWKYCLRIDSRELSGGAVGLGRFLKEKGIASAPRYIQKPAFMCEIFQKQRTLGDSRFPFSLARPEVLDYDPSRFQGTFSALEGILVLPWNERYTEEHINYISSSILQAHDQLWRQ